MESSGTAVLIVLFVGFGILFFLMNIMLLVRFFQMCKNVKEIKNILLKK